MSSPQTITTEGGLNVNLQTLVDLKLADVQFFVKLCYLPSNTIGLSNETIWPLIEQLHHPEYYHDIEELLDCISVSEEQTMAYDPKIQNTELVLLMVGQLTEEDHQKINKEQDEFDSTIMKLKETGELFANTVETERKKQNDTYNQLLELLPAAENIPYIDKEKLEYLIQKVSDLDISTLPLFSTKLNTLRNKYDQMVNEAKDKEELKNERLEMFDTHLVKIMKRRGIEDSEIAVYREKIIENPDNYSEIQTKCLELSKPGISLSVLNKVREQ